MAENTFPPCCGGANGNLQGCRNPGSDIGLKTWLAPCSVLGVSNQSGRLDYTEERNSG